MSNKNYKRSTALNSVILPRIQVVFIIVYRVLSLIFSIILVLMGTFDK